MSLPLAAAPTDPAPLSISFPGTADQVLGDGDFFTEEPEIAAAYRASYRLVRRGNGHTCTVTLSPTSWTRLAEYLASKEGALQAAYGDTRDRFDRRELAAVGKLLTNLATAGIRVRRWL